ncbi:MAG: hypothetical protein K9G71_18975, partial [Rhodobacteraceae bacterium]|nr:hypothetical protein [Paracoccaceae bacterium]MCF8520747.1 hypothetical protein [Paracoccaceae bacterium]
MTLPASITVIEVGSGAILTYDQFDALTSIDLRSDAIGGELEVLVSSLEQAQAVDGSAKIDADIDVSINVAGGDAGNLSVQGHADLTALTADDSWSYSIVDTAENLLANGAAEPLTTADTVSVADGAAGSLSIQDYADLIALTTNDAWSYDIVDSVASLFADGSLIAGVDAILENAGTVTVSGALDVNQLQILEGLNANLEVSPFVTSITLSDSALAVGETATVTVTFSEAVTGVELGDFTANNGVLSDLSAASLNDDGTQTYTFTLTPTAAIEDASNVVTLAASKVVDGFGNANVASASSANYAIDTLAPRATIQVSDSALAVGETATVTVTFTEAVTGVLATDFAAENGVLTNLSAPTDNLDGTQTYTLTLTPTANIADTTNVVTLAANQVNDTAGNANTVAASSLNYAIDTVAPTATIQVSDSALAVGETATVTVTFSSAVTGVELVDFAADSGLLSNLSAPTNNLDGSQTYTLTLTPTVAIEDTTNVVSLAANRAADAAGNGNVEASSANYAIDTLAPTAEITLADVALVAGGSTTVTITFSEAVKVSELSVGDFTVESGSLSNLSPVAAVSGYATSFTADLTAANLSAPDASNLIQLSAGVVSDVAGNTNTASPAVNFGVDTDVTATWAEFTGANTLSIDGTVDAAQPSKLTITGVPDGASIPSDEARLFNATTGGEQNAIRGVEELVFVGANGAVIDFDLGANAEGAGIDKVTLSGDYARSTLNFEGRNSGVEVVTAGGFDNITGSNYGDTITSGAGLDSLDGGQGNDTFKFADADLTNLDTIVGGEGDDTIEIVDDADFGGNELDSASSIETLKLSGTGSQYLELYIRNALTVDATASTVGSYLDAYSMEANVTVLGGSGNDTIFGGAGVDSLVGNDGDDTFVAEDSDAKIDGGAGDNTVEFAAAVSAVNLIDGDLVNVQNVVLTGDDNLTYDFSVQTEALNIDGGASRDFNDVIIGGLGADTLRGGAGDDSLSATDTDAMIDGGSGTDTVLFNAAVSAANLLDADLVAVENVEITNAGNAAYDFSAQTEALTITGFTGADTITGGSAADSIVGGNGDDVIVATDTDQIV